MLFFFYFAVKKVKEIAKCGTIDIAMALSTRIGLSGFDNRDKNHIVYKKGIETIE